MKTQDVKLSEKYAAEKVVFHTALSEFAKTLENHIALDGNWTVKGFIDVFKISILFRLIQRFYQKSLSCIYFRIFLTLREVLAT